MKKVLVIAGPTGVGKTSLSIELAKKLHGEIISGDSMQVYRELNIGTAKVSQEEMEGIPHYMIDAYSYQSDYNVKVFQEQARAYIEQITACSKLPIICGGTGLYIKSAVYDYRFIDQEEDPQFQSFLMQRSNDELYAMLRIVDLQATEKIHPHNRQRMMRALMMAHTGEKKSEIVASQEHKPLYDVFVIGLTMDREHLYERINERVDQMMKDGLLEEITELVERDPNLWELQSMKSIGYKEWEAYFHGTASKEECVELIKKNSRNFAKKQYTWFHNQMDVTWYHIEESEWKQQLMHDLKQWLS